MLKDDQIVWAIHQMEADIGPVGPFMDNARRFNDVAGLIMK